MMKDKEEKTLAPEYCSYCKGSGEIMNGHDMDWREYWMKCPKCNGSGFVTSEQDPKETT